MRPFDRNDVALLRSLASEFEEKVGAADLAEVIELRDLADRIEDRIDEATGVEAMP